MWKSLVGALTALSLVGCGSLSSPEDIGKSMMAFGKRMDAREDSETAAAVNAHSGSISFRTSRLHALPKTHEAMKESCKRGNHVEIIVPVKLRGILQRMPRDCIRVYFSDHPELNESQNILAVNFDLFWVDGMPSRFTRDDIQREYRTRQYFRKYAL
ncbi:hypothetical protein LC612_36610 [Nostoc sp. CHAB 5834]|nr:hypothetical protein [Nostoc sp. CHAB 5834]